MFQRDSGRQPDREASPSAWLRGQIDPPSHRLDFPGDDVHPDPSARDRIGLAPGREPGFEDQGPEPIDPRPLVRPDQAEPSSLGLDRLVVEPPSVVPDFQDHRVPLAAGLQRNPALGGLAGSSSVVGSLDPVPDRVPDDMQERLVGAVEQEAVGPRLLADQIDGD